MQTVMISAKERGLTVPHIFKYFMGKGKEEMSDEIEESEFDKEITPEQFEGAMKALSPNLFNVSAEELKGLIDEFDEDGNGTISLAEFRNYCYRIPHLAWKAERLRFESGADAPGSTKTKRTPTKSKKALDLPGGTPVAAVTVPAKLAQIHKGTKHFWHTGEKVELELFQSKPYGCLAVVASVEKGGATVVCPPLFLDLDVVNDSQDPANFEKICEQRIAGLERAALNKRSGEKLTEAEKGEARELVRREAYANWVMLRMKIEGGKALLIKTLSSDPPEVAATVLMPTTGPEGFPLSELPMPDVREAVDFGAGAELMDSLNAMNKEAADATKSAQRAQKLLAMSAAAFGGMAEATKRRKQGSKAKQKMYAAFMRYIVGKQVELVRQRLESSPTYHALLQEQEEKRAAAAESASGLKLPQI